jgi:DNA-directed RNA polymerase subunit RPC12/RpoP
MAKKGERTGVYVNCEYCGKLVYKTQTNFTRRINADIRWNYLMPQSFE